MIIVTGPRIDPASFPHHDGLETHGDVHRLYRQLAACDLALSHGGLSTTMELTAAGRPFLYFTLGDHFGDRDGAKSRARAPGRCAPPEPPGQPP